MRNGPNAIKFCKNDGDQNTLKQEGSAVHLMGLERNNLLGLASIWASIKFESLPSRSGPFKAKDCPDTARIDQ